METWAGGARQRDPSWTGNISTATSVLTRRDRHSRGSTFRNGLWMVSDKVATKLWKNSWDVTAINTFLLHCIVVRTGERQAPFFFSARSMVTSDLSASRWGGGCGGGEGADGKFQRVPSLRTDGGGGGGSNVSGGTQISWPFQRFSVYFETCQRLYRENVH